MYLLNRRSVSKAKPYLLLHCNGADASTTFTDNSPEGHTIAVVGDAQVDTAQSKFSGSSLYLAGSDDVLYTAGGDWNFTASENITIECFARITAAAGNDYIISYYEDANNYWALYQESSGSFRFYAVDATSGVAVNVTSGVGDVSVDTWYHVAMCKVGNEYGIYMDGIQKAHDSDANDMSITVTNLYIGCHYESGGSYYSEFQGHLDEIRIVKGNPFNAAPVVGLTDKIQVPQQPYPSWV